jgi:alkylation response protein AidB-like acyl-CoA dehydrogenase
VDFKDTPEQGEYREKVRRWLHANAYPKGYLASLPSDAERLVAARAWQLKKYEAGYSCITWPKDVGGQGGSSIQQVIYNQEEAGFEVPRGYFDITFGMCLPTVMKTADPETTARFVPPALRGEEIWCQLFSEPAAGSDLAGLRTRAVRDGDEWVINGQKVWTSGAHYSDYGLLIARSNPDKPKHKGLTMFWMDMRSPGVEVRPIKQMSGRSGFNEVWFDNLRIPDSQRLGEVDDGWRVSLITLMTERLSIGGGAGVNFADLFAVANSIAQDEGGTLAQDRAFRENLADWYVQAEGVKLTGFRVLTALSRGQTPGPESSISKVVTANLTQTIAKEMLDLQGEFALVSDPDVALRGGLYQAQVMSSPGSRLAGGTDEILRNIIAERVLGLPAETRVDKDIPFKDIPTA